MKYNTKAIIKKHELNLIKTIIQAKATKKFREFWQAQLEMPTTSSSNYPSGWAHIATWEGDLPEDQIIGGVLFTAQPYKGDPDPMIWYDARWSQKVVNQKEFEEFKMSLLEQEDFLFCRETIKVSRKFKTVSFKGYNEGYFVEIQNKTFNELRRLFLVVQANDIHWFISQLEEEARYCR